MSVTIETQVQCSTSRSWSKQYESSDGKSTYTVELEESFGPYQYEMTCTCKGFKFRRTCKHVVQAEKHDYCGWNQQWGVERYKHDGKCPKCGEKVEGVRVAV